MTEYDKFESDIFNATGKQIGVDFGYNVAAPFIWEIWKKNKEGVGVKAELKAKNANDTALETIKFLKEDS